MDISAYLSGVQHIGVPTADMAASEAFYSKLGFEKKYETLNDGNRVCFFQQSGVVFEVYESPLAAGCFGAIDHVALNVKNVDELFEKVCTLGIKVRTPRVRQLPFFEKGVRFFTVEGPNLEKIEFNEYL